MAARETATEMHFHFPGNVAEKATIALPVDMRTHVVGFGCDASAAVAISVPMNAPTVKRRGLIERMVAVAGLVTVAAAPIMWHGAVTAQEAASCAQIATAAERLACYDRALPPPEAPSAPPIEPLPPTQPPKPAQPSPLVEAASPATAPGSGADAERPEATAIVVVGMRKYPGRSASFTTDKGEVWIQIGAESVYLPKVPFEAELRPASMGTYFLRPNDYGWRVHVRAND